ncbi:MAG: large subunit ribosomal protein L28 [Rhodospirillaceae bacterium]|nr:MAG: large subunit ribosomal protein L28 [Rhodospirillaceae bacterium]
MTDMARRCTVTGKGVLVGNNVSHANNKTKRRFLPNLQETSLWSDALERTVRLRLSINGLRSIEHNGGLDSYLQSVSTARLSLDARRLKQQIIAARTRREGESAGQGASS